MGEKTGIKWTDHTFNPWWGCQRVSEACKNCYAARESERFGFVGFFDGKYRRFFGNRHWEEPLTWNAKAESAGRVESVFCGSMCDIFEDAYAGYEKNYIERPSAIRVVEERTRVFDLISQTPFLNWLLLTKRPENIAKMIPGNWRNSYPSNVRIGVTAENQYHVDSRIPILLRSWSGKNFISVEPMLGPVDLSTYIDKSQLDWVICGGESGPIGKIRRLNSEWVLSLQDQCASKKVPFFFKQWGSQQPGNLLGGSVYEEKPL